MHNDSSTPDAISHFRKAQQVEQPAVPDQVPSWGPYITAHFQSASRVKLHYAEIIVPSTGSANYIYWSLMNPDVGAHPSYAGIQRSNTAINALGNNICSFWDSTELPPDSLPQVTLIGGPAGVYWDHFGNEGTGLHTSNQNVWKVDQRYAMVICRWDRPDDGKHSYVSMFMYSFSDQRWSHYMSARIPGHDLMLAGNLSGFLERFAGSATHYFGHYGNYFRQLENGSWQKPIRYTVGAGRAPWNATLTAGLNGQDVKVQVGQTPERDAEIALTPTQQSQPSILQAPIVHSLRAIHYSKSQATVCSWVADEKTPPPIATELTIVRDAVYGQDVHKVRIMGPMARSAIIELPLNERDNHGSYSYFVRIEYWDIFGAKSNNGYTQLRFDHESSIVIPPH